MTKLSSAQKKYLLIAIVLVFSWLVWQIAFKKTFEEYSRYKMLSESDDNYSGISYPQAYNLRKKQNLETIMQGYKQDSTTFRNNLIYQVAYQAGKQNVKVVQVPMLEETVLGRVMQRVTFQGSYFSLILLLIELKKVRGIGRVRSIKIWQPMQTNKMLLTTMDVYFICLDYKM